MKRLSCFGIGVLAVVLAGVASADEPNARDYSKGTSGRKSGIQVFNKNQTPASTAQIRSTPQAQSVSIEEQAKILKAQVLGAYEENNGKAVAECDAVVFLERCMTSEAVGKIQSTPEGKQFLAKLTQSPKWMRDFLDLSDCYSPYSNRRFDLGNAVEITASILTAPENRGDMNHPTFRNLATAYGVVYGASHLTQKLKNNDPKAMYASYKKAFKANRLHPDFKNYAAWEMIYFATFWHSLESMEWMRDNINLPKKRMNGTCWRAEYQGFTPFGYSIHGPDYYRPWDECTEPWARMRTIAEIGGVCGSLSNLGAMASMAQGVPSFPVGQPGHCAYGVRVKPGEWVGGFGGPGGSSGENPLAVFSHETDFLFLIDEMFSHPRFRACRSLTALAIILRDDKPAESDKLIRRAISLQPNNIFAWDVLLTWTKDAKLSRNEIAELGIALGKGFVKRPAVALTLAKRLAPLYQGTEKADAVLAFYEPVMRAGAENWSGWIWKLYMNHHFRDFLRSKEYKLDFTKMILNAYAKSQFFPEVISWAQDQFKDDSTAQAVLLTELSKALSGGDTTDPETFRKTLAQLIVLSGQNGAAAPFQQFAKMAEQNLGDREKGRIRDNEKWRSKITPFTGDCMSADGVFKPTSTSGWDMPLLHGRLLTPQLGFFHTGSDLHAGGEVTLARLTEPSGIIIVAGTGNNSRVPPVVVSVSENGTAWEEVYRNDKYEDIYRIDLSDKPRRIRHVRIERGDDRKEHYHLQGILVYGRRLQ